MRKLVLIAALLVSEADDIHDKRIEKEIKEGIEEPGHIPYVEQVVKVTVISGALPFDER